MLEFDKPINKESLRKEGIIVVDTENNSKLLDIKLENLNLSDKWDFSEVDLNEALIRIGGHIGYSIRPTRRGEKFGNIILQKVLEQAKLKGLDKVMLTIREDNIPSRKVCERNGGKLEKIEFIENNKECFYWIDIPQR